MGRKCRNLPSTHLIWGASILFITIFSYFGFRLFISFFQTGCVCVALVWSFDKFGHFIVNIYKKTPTTEKSSTLFNNYYYYTLSVIRFVSVQFLFSAYLTFDQDKRNRFKAVLLPHYHEQSKNVQFGKWSPQIHTHT